MKCFSRQKKKGLEVCVARMHKSDCTQQWCYTEAARLPFEFPLNKTWQNPRSNHIRKNTRLHFLALVARIVYTFAFTIANSFTGLFRQKSAREVTGFEHVLCKVYMDFSVVLRLRMYVGINCA
jgi:hypothetical protein